MCIHQTPDPQMHPAYPNLQIPVRFLSGVLSHGIQLDLFFLTMVPRDLRVAAADARGVYDLWIGVDAIVPVGRMVVDWRNRKLKLIYKSKSTEYDKPIPFPNL